MPKQDFERLLKETQNLQVMGQHDNALNSLRLALQNTTLRDLFRLADEHRIAKRILLAEAIYSIILEREPDSVEALVELGSTLRSRGEFADARELFRRASEIGSLSYTWPWLHLAGELRRNGEIPEAMAAIRSALLVDSFHLEALLEAGVTSRMLKADREALEFFATAVRAHPESARARSYYGEQLRLAGEWKSAELEFQVAAQLAPTDPAPLVELGVIARHLGNSLEAMAKFKAAVELAPSECWPHIHYAVELRGVGRFDHALAELDAALSIDPEHVFALVEAGLTSRAASRYDRALAYFERAHRGDPKNFLAGLNFAAELRRASRYPEAIAILESMLDLSEACHSRIYFECHLTEWLAGSRQALFDLLELVRPTAFEASQWINSDVADGLVEPDVFGLGAIEYLKQAEHVDMRFISVDQVAGELRNAINAKKEYSVVRAADGEGAFLAYALTRRSESDAHKLNGLLIGEQRWFTWLGQHIADADEASLSLLEQEFRQAIASADVVGIEPLLGSWRKRHDYISLHGTVESHRYATTHGTGHFTAAQINVLLHSETNFYSWLLSNVDFVGLITCHKQIREMIETTFKIQRIDEYIIPFEVGHSPVFHYGEISVRHFPDYFCHLRETLKVPFPGAVFLVAAGIFGKVYCNWIKQQGGIAIDIGAMADAFAGFNTRPSIDAVYRSNPLTRLLT
jgi:tetratricopeptide (TPR) repeat protein